MHCRHRRVGRQCRVDRVVDRAPIDSGGGYVVLGLVSDLIAVLKQPNGFDPAVATRAMDPSELGASVWRNAPGDLANQFLERLALAG